MLHFITLKFKRNCQILSYITNYTTYNTNIPAVIGRSHFRPVLAQYQRISGRIVLIEVVDVVLGFAVAVAVLDHGDSVMRTPSSCFLVRTSRRPSPGFRVGFNRRNRRYNVRKFCDEGVVDAGQFGNAVLVAIGGRLFDRRLIVDNSAAQDAGLF